MGTILEHLSLPEAVGRRLRHRILNNELPAGTRLVEANLAAEFGVSRGTIRDAMRGLRSLRLALEHMSAAAVTDDLDALVDSDTKFHEQLIDLSGRSRLKGLWSMLDSQMGALMRSAVERQGIGLMDAVERHRQLLEAVDSGDVGQLRLAIRRHYLQGFPEHEAELSTRSAGASA